MVNDKDLCGKKTRKKKAFCPNHRTEGHGTHSGYLAFIGKNRA